MDFDQIKTNFIALCHAAYDADNMRDYTNASAKAHGYMNALIDVLGTELAEQVYNAAERSFTGEVETAFGIPRRHKESALQPT